MHRNQLPGRPIHVRVAGDHVLVMFDLIPWQFRHDDVAGAVTAFSNNDWSFFQKAWWSKHEHLTQSSRKLALLVNHISPEDLFSANRLISLGSFLGLYGTWDLSEMEQDYQRLALMPLCNEWPSEGLGEVRLQGDKARPGWPGHMWRAAIAGHRAFEVANGNLNLVVQESLRPHQTMRSVCNF